MHQLQQNPSITVQSHLYGNKTQNYLSDLQKFMHVACFILRKLGVCQYAGLSHAHSHNSQTCS